MTQVFLSYRRSDTRADAGRLYDRLTAHFGDDGVFMDLDDIHPGEDFVRVLETTLDRSHAMLVLIGPSWIEDREAGRRRLDDPADYVRLELETALARGIQIIPVLVGGARIPPAEALPESLRALVTHQVQEISDSRFHADVDRLIDAIEGRPGWLGAAARWLARNRVVTGAFTVAALLVLAVAVIQPIRDSRARAEAVRTHLSVAQQFLDQERGQSAVAELEKAVALAPRDVAVQRALIGAITAVLLRKAFGPDHSRLDMALRRGFRGHPLVDGAEVDAALARVYALQSQDPELADDPDLLLARGLMLKAAGSRMEQAMDAFEAGLRAAPQRAELLAELGLLEAMVAGRGEGIERLRAAVARAADVVRFRFYLGRALAETSSCAYVSQSPDGDPDAGAACAEAIRILVEASRDAGQGDVWSRQIRRVAASDAYAILRRYALGEGGILAPNLAMPLSERITQLEFLVARHKPSGRSGWEDHPGYWLAILLAETGDRARARALLEALFEEFGERPQPWQALYERLVA